MTQNLLNAIKSIVEKEGAAVLLNPQYVDENLPVFAGKEAAAERKAFVACLKAGLPAELQQAQSPAARLERKKRVAQKLANEQGLDPSALKEAADLVESLAGSLPAPHAQQPQEKTPSAHRKPAPTPPPAMSSPVPQPVITPVSAGSASTAKLRHGFTTFWLWLCMIVDGLEAVICLYYYQDTNEEYFGVFGLLSALGVVGYWQMLHWKKLGFWLLIARAIGNVAYQTYNGWEDRNTLVIINSIFTVILFGILCLRTTNGLNTWEQLE